VNAATSLPGSVCPKQISTGDGTILGAIPGAQQSLLAGAVRAGSLGRAGQAEELGEVPITVQPYGPAHAARIGSAVHRYQHFYRRQGRKRWHLPSGALRGLSLSPEELAVLDIAIETRSAPALPSRRTTSSIYARRS
jgi:hypothetical protein